MSNERTLINLRGYCLFCLKKIECESNSTPGGFSSSCATPTPSTPVPPSPLSTPLRTKCYNVHNLPLEERLAPFSDLCQYLGVDNIPDCFAFGDGVDPEVLYPPLCEKCHELTARLCVLQDELTYIKTRITNTVERIHRRVASTCDQRGVIVRQGFNRDFQRKSKGSLSRGRDANPETKKVNELLKAFQVKIIQKDHEIQQRKKVHTTVLFPPDRLTLGPPKYDYIPHPDDEPEMVVQVVDCKKENEEAENSEVAKEKDVSSLSASEFLPLEETLRSNCHSVRSHLSPKVNNTVVENFETKPYPDISTILYSFQQDETVAAPKSGQSLVESYTDKSTVLVEENGQSQLSPKRIKFDWNAQRKSPDEKRYKLRERPRKVSRYFSQVGQR